MRKWIKRTLIGIPSVLLLCGFGAYVWFWGAPVGINNYINKKSLQLVTDSPEMLTFLGIIDNTPLDRHSGKLADYSEAQWDKSTEKTKDLLKGLEKFKDKDLSEQERLSYEITKWLFEDEIKGEAYRYSSYPINQLSGPQVDLPSFLTDTHAVVSKKSAKRYLSRVREFGRVLSETHTNVQTHAENGVIAPDFIIEKTILGMESFIKGGVEENPLVKTLPARLDKVEKLSQSNKDEIMTEVKTAVQDLILPGYEKLIAQQKSLLTQTNSDAGIWRIPNGDKIYQLALRSNTTTDFTADDIHNTGLSEVARIEKAMDLILQGEGLSEGTVSERVQIMMTKPEQLFPNTEEGRQAMLDYLVELNTDIMSKADEYFITLPPQKLEIKRIPEFSEDSAPGGYYQGPSLNGKRPGSFYINQKDTADNPKWTLPTLLYHEAAPGHHFQISRSMLVKDVPILRKMSPFTAYSEGWALYAEKIAAEDIGLYADNPLGDLGRLQAEQFRAVRLVVDTGIHHKKWSREKAIEYMISKTGMTEANVTREIERYVVWPGQATAYKTGQLAIIRMRGKAEAALGTDFNLREFNEMTLEDGAMPLGILDKKVDRWIAGQVEE